MSNKRFKAPGTPPRVPKGAKVVPVDMSRMGMAVFFSLDGVADVKGLRVDRSQAIVWLRELADRLETGDGIHDRDGEGRS